MSVYFCLDSDVLPLSVCRCLYHNKERVRRAVWGDCKLSVAHKFQSPSTRPQLVTISWRSSAFPTMEAATLWEMGLPRVCLRCTAVTCPPCLSGRLSEQVEAVCQKSYLNVFFGAKGSCHLSFAHNCKASSHIGDIWRLTDLFVNLMLHSLCCDFLIWLILSQQLQHHNSSRW